MKMIPFSHRSTIASSFIAAVFCFGGAGCSEWGGGAAVVPSVTFLPADLTGEAAEAGDDANASSAGEVAEAGGVGSIKGRVVFTGTPRTLNPIHAKGAAVKDAEVCAFEEVPDERFILGADNGVRDVFIYLAKKPKGMPKPTVSDVELEFDQQWCRFSPHCMVVPVGQTLKVLSNDSVAHNTHTFPSKNQEVNSVVSPGDRDGKLKIVYTRAESVPIAVKCDYHPWMTAYHLPIDHSFVAVSDKDGHFEISNLPSGEHEFVVWHEAAVGKFVERKLKVTVAVGDPTPLEISYPQEKLGIK